jgi:predicted GNAT family acetyltransferase
MNECKNVCHTVGSGHEVTVQTDNTKQNKQHTKQNKQVAAHATHHHQTLPIISSAQTKQTTPTIIEETERQSPQLLQ